MTERPLRFTYAFDNRIPSPQADTEQVVSNLSALSRRGLDATLLLPRIGPETDAEAIRAFYATTGRFEVAYYPRGHGLHFMQKLWAGLVAGGSRFVREADFVYTRNLPIALGCVARGHRVFFEAFRPWPDQFPLLVPVIRRLMRSPHFVGGVFHSALARDAHIRAGAPPERLMVGHNGWEPSRMEPVLTREEAREKLGLPTDRPIAMYTGRIVGTKGLDVVLKAAADCEDVSFVLVGARGEDPVEREAEAVPNVSLAPWQSYDALSDWLYAADVLIIPPSSDPLEKHGKTVLPIKLFSYLAAGRPIVAPAAADVMELLSDGENALLVQPGDSAGTAEAIQRIVSDADLWGRLAAGALDTASGLTWDARAERIHDFIAGRLDRLSEGE